MPSESLHRLHFFERIAPHYDFLVDLLTFGLYARFLRKAVRILDPGQGDTILDLCSGTGRVASWIGQSVGENGRVVGMDIAESMVEIAGSRYGNYGNLIFLQQDVTHPWNYQGKLDAIFTSFSVHELPKDGRMRTLKQSFGALNEKGRMVIADFNPQISGPGRVLVQMFFGIFERPNLNFLSFKQEEMLRGIGFKTIQTFPVAGGLFQITLARKSR
jgi:ubiquinone/menaquinone biosynthesis C-methylase UbiE